MSFCFLEESFVCVHVCKYVLRMRSTIACLRLKLDLGGVLYDSLRNTGRRVKLKRYVPLHRGGGGVFYVSLRNTRGRGKTETLCFVT